MADRQASSPDLTIVVPTLNRVDVVDRCLRSLIEQQGASFEIIVVDGGSTDGTVDAIKTLADALVHWESQPDSGIFDAWNKGLRKARGSWIGFLGADDRFAASTGLAAIAAAIAASPADVTMVYPHAVYVDEEGFTHWETGCDWIHAKRQLVRGLMTIPPGVFFRRDVFERTGLFDPAFQTCGDFDMVLREAKTHDAAFANSAVILVGVGGVSWRPENRTKVLLEIRRSLRKNGITSLPWSWYFGYLGITALYARTRKRTGQLLRRFGVLGPICLVSAFH